MRVPASHYENTAVTTNANASISTKKRTTLLNLTRMPYAVNLGPECIFLETLVVAGREHREVVQGIREGSAVSDESQLSTPVPWADDAPPGQRVCHRLQSSNLKHRRVKQVVVGQLPIRSDWNWCAHGFGRLSMSACITTRGGERRSRGWCCEYGKSSKQGDW